MEKHLKGKPLGVMFPKQFPLCPHRTAFDEDSGLMFSLRSLPQMGAGFPGRWEGWEDGNLMKAAALSLRT